MVEWLVENVDQSSSVLDRTWEGHQMLFLPVADVLHLHLQSAQGMDPCCSQLARPV